MNKGEIVALCLFFVFVLGPAVYGFFAYQEKKLKLQRDLAANGGQELQAQLAHALAEIERLRQRMAIMEKLVTDDDRKLAHEIDALRRPQGPEARG
jgi:uncharacterized protein HemX